MNSLRFLGLGAQLAVSILLLVLLGQWVDRKVGTDGVFTIAGAFVAFAGTMVSLVWQLKKKKDDPP